MAISSKSMLMTSLLLLAIQSADDALEYEMRNRLKELYDAYVAPEAILKGVETT